MPRTAANRDHLWNVVNDFLGKPGFHGFVDAGTENAPLITVEIRYLMPGLSYDVYGRFGTAPLQSAPNYVGAEMGLAPSGLVRYDQFSSGATVLTDWSNWQEREVYLRVASVTSNLLRVYFDESSIGSTAAWTGLRLVKK